MIQQALKLIWKRKGKNSLLITEILLSFIILFSIFSLLTKVFSNYLTPLGFAYEDVAEIAFDSTALSEKFPHPTIDDTMDTLAYRDEVERIRENLLAVNGVEQVSYSTSVVPFAGNTWSSGNGEEVTDENPYPYDNAHLIFASVDYAKVHEPNLIQGRWFTEEDVNQKYLPMVVNQKFIENYGRGETNFVGKKVQLWGELREVVGVVDAFKYGGEFNESFPLMIPYISDPGHIDFFNLKFNADKNPNWEYDLNQATKNSLNEITFASYKLDDARWALSRQYWAPIAGMLALCAFLIFNVAMGLFGTLQYSIKKRRGEIGLRKSIGATNGQIRSQFLAETFILTALGLILGLLIAVQVPLLNLFNIEDKHLYIGMGVALAIIVAIVFLSSLLPSIQASRVQPAIALHEE